MLTEYDIILYAAARGWTTTVDLLHAHNGIYGVFLSRGAMTYLLGPLKAVQQMQADQLLAYLEHLHQEVGGSAL